jgi:uncharacterized delta-60 repeat protein
MGKRAAFVALIAVLAAALGAGEAAAAGLDPTFGSAGRMTLPVGPASGDEDTAYAVALQPDGKIVLAGSFGPDDARTDDFAVARLRPDGSPDPAFGGGDGRLTIDASAGLPYDVDAAQAVAIQDDGKIVLAGYAGAPFLYDPGGDFAAVRLNANGTPDGSFGGGDGIVTVDVSGSLEDAAFGVAVENGGKIVLAGQADAPWDFGLARLDPDGSLDDSDGGSAFGGDGIVTTNVAPRADLEDAAAALAIQPNGRIVGAGWADSGPLFPNSDFAFARYLPNGSLDPGFSGDGRSIVPVGTDPDFPWDEATSLALQPDGRLVAAGWAIRRGTGYEDVAVVRLTPAGAADPSFSADGRQTLTASPVGETSAANAVALQANGKIVTAGRTVARHSDLNPLDFGLARFEPDGDPDARFGCDGALTVPIAPGDRLDVAFGLAVQTNGRIVAAGASDMAGGDFSDLDFSALRLDEARPGPDCTPPETRIVSGPRKKSSDRSPTFKFKASEAGASFACKLDTAGWKQCASPKKLKRLDYTKHRFRVRATDAAGNTDPTPATQRFKIVPR